MPTIEQIRTDNDPEQEVNDRFSEIVARLEDLPAELREIDKLAPDAAAKPTGTSDMGYRYAR